MNAACLLDLSLQRILATIERYSGAYEKSS